MAILPAVPLTLKCVFSGTNSPSKWANILHVTYATGTPNAANLTTIAQNLATLWGTNMMAHQHTNGILTQTLVQDVSSNTGAAGIDTTTHAGLISGIEQPANVAVTISWKIARRYRGGHPRTYLPAIPTGIGPDNQTMSAVTAGQFNTDATNFRTGVSTMSVAGFTGFNLANVSYFQGHQPGLPEKPVPRPVPVVDLIVGNHVDLRLDTIRRRLGKGRG